MTKALEEDPRRKRLRELGESRVKDEQILSQQLKERIRIEADRAEFFRLAEELGHKLPEPKD